MKRKEFLKRLKEVGFNVNSFSEFVSMHPSSISRWDEVPKWAIVLLEGMEAKRDLKEIKRILENTND